MSWILLNLINQFIFCLLLLQIFYQRKLYYGEWLETLPDNWYILHKFDTLKMMFDEYEVVLENIEAAIPEAESRFKQLSEALDKADINTIVGNIS